MVYSIPSYMCYELVCMFTQKKKKNWFVFIKKFIVSTYYKIEIDQILS